MAENLGDKLGVPTMGDITELRAALRQLQARVDRQSIVITALKEMLLATSTASEADFLNLVAKAASEKADGKNCRQCGKVMNAKHARCMYCGETRPPELL